MTTRFRSRWLALFGAAALISLSMSATLGAKPDGTNRGQQVSAFVHSLQGETEEPVEEEPVEEEPVEEDSAPSDHGKCVAAVAHDKEAVGPPNDNHGGAVSEAARVTCWEDEASDESTEDESSQEDAETEDADDADSAEESEDADSSDADSEHGNGHGHGHGGDSSDD